jgi:hypothetical protein
MSKVTDEDIRRIARTCHEINRFYCIGLGDNSQAIWPDAPEWQRESCISGVLAIHENRVTSPQESHASWMKSKKADGWKYGTHKDVEFKEHPCMVPFDELPLPQQTKDYLFYLVTNSLICEIEEGKEK